MKTISNGGNRFERCDRCAYGDGTGEGQLRCLRHAPRAIALCLTCQSPVTVITYWPLIPPEKWCGDFLPKPQCVN